MGFGAMRLPGVRGQEEPQAAGRLLRRAEALHPYPPGLIIGTKSGYGRGRSGEWFQDGRPETIRRQAERSLELLRIERIDLLQLHVVDPAVPIEDSVGAIVDLQAEGKVRLIGVSNVSAGELERARAVGEIASVQN